VLIRSASHAHSDTGTHSAHFQTIRDSHIKGDFDKIMAYLSEQGASSVGAIGFCWGVSVCVMWGVGGTSTERVGESMCGISFRSTASMALNHC
jgi:hypothetical protein